MESRSFNDPPRSRMHHLINRIGRKVEEEIKVFHIEMTVNNDTFPNNTLWFLNPFAESTNPGSWTLDQIPEPSRAVLALMGLVPIAFRRRRKVEA